MDFIKSFKLILGLFLGFCILSVLAYVATIPVFRTVTQSEGSTVEESSNSGVVGAPEYDKGGMPSDGRDLLYPSPNPMPGSNGGDGSKLIKSATLGIKVKDFDKTIGDMKAKVTDVKGFVQYLTDSGTLNNRTVSIIVRVPQDKFEETLTLFKGYATEVVTLNEGADDISETYQDMQARLKNQKAFEKQLLVLLDKATKVSDILSIQQQLAVVREQIEMYESQLKNYDTQVKMSSINVTLYQAQEAINVVGNEWKLVGVTKEAFAALVYFGKGLLTFTVWAVVFSPVVLIPYAIYKVVKSNKKGKK